MGSGASAPRNTGTTDSKARTAFALRPTRERITLREVAALPADALRDDVDRDALSDTRSDARSDGDEDVTNDSILRRVFARVAGCVQGLCCFGRRESLDDATATVDLGACCLWSVRGDLLGGRPPDAETGGFVEDRHGRAYVEVGSVVRVLTAENVDEDLAFTVVSRKSGRYKLQPKLGGDVVKLTVPSEDVRSTFQVLDVPDDVDEPEDEGDQMRSIIEIVNDKSQWDKWRIELALTRQAIARGENPPPPPEFDMPEITGRVYDHNFLVEGDGFNTGTVKSASADFKAELRRRREIYHGQRGTGSGRGAEDGSHAGLQNTSSLKLRSTLVL